ncbi:hypothetical protein J1N35_009410 [Gossypium stocksii]|uniref:CENP-V/GFA domain-containing protein n=1 Tax=Gossypium stocksii TaxID=47602 RepID=A0A9D4A9K9_9ROSI|nr:hypothetical protein J1N35_009410 [Gossypium stocksii]
MESELVLHNGGCHCKKVRWKVQAPTSVIAWKCNCSDCSMRVNVHSVVPRQRFELLGDSDQFITTYTFGTHTAIHSTLGQFPMSRFGMLMARIGRTSSIGVALLYNPKSIPLSSWKYTPTLVGLSMARKTGLH